MSARRMVAVALVASAGCSAFRNGSDTPHIDSVKPDSVFFAAGTVIEVVVQGHGFAPGAPGRNIVQFGDVKLTQVPASEDGTQIRFVIPDRSPSRGDAAPLPLETGRYAVRIETGSGVSNAVEMKVDR